MSVLALSLALTLQASGPYVRAHTSADAGSHCLWWDESKLGWAQSSVGNPTTGASAFSAVSTAFLTWGDTMKRCGNLTLTEGAHVNVRKLGSATNTVLFRASSCAKKVAASNACWAAGTCGDDYDCWDHSSALLGVTTVSYDTSSGQILHADIELDAADNVFTTVNSPVCTSKALQSCVATDVQNTVTHEVGHFLGLGHTTAANSTMNATAALGETSKRSLDTGTASFVCEVYTQGLATKDCVVNPVSEELGAAAPSTGCSSSGQLASLWGLGLVVLTALRRRARWVLPVALVAITAQATTLLALDVDALTAGSDLVAQVHVRSVHARWTADHSRIVTDVELEVTDAWKGSAARTVIVTQPGGEVGRVGQLVEGVARFEAGEDAVVFLEARGARFTVTGLQQGAFHLTRAADGSVVASQAGGEALYLDLLTRQPVDQQPRSFHLAFLKQQVLGAVNQSHPAAAEQ